MKLLTLKLGESHHLGVQIGDEVLDVVAARATINEANDIPDSLKVLIEQGPAKLDALRAVVAKVADPTVAEQLRTAGALKPMDQVVLAPPIPDPEMILSGSMNSHGHLGEMNDPLPETPCAFHKVRSALTASGTAIAPPPGHSDMIDWEGEFCIVFGRRCHRVSADEAMDYVFGYTIMNDISAREYALPFIQAKGASPTAQAWERNVLGKNFPGFAPVGPVIATKDEMPTPLTYYMETVVNGEVMQKSTQDDLVFNPSEMISFFSEFYIFQPGDIMSMGSPPGVGMARRPQVFLKSGDVVEVKVAEIGTLRNHIGASEV